jgi:hypothetical protein
MEELRRIVFSATVPIKSPTSWEIPVDGSKLNPLRVGAEADDSDLERKEVPEDPSILLTSSPKTLLNFLAFFNRFFFSFASNSCAFGRVSTIIAVCYCSRGG